MGQFIDMVSGAPLFDFSERYSRMKYGSVPDIEWMGAKIARSFIGRLNDPADNLIRLFQNAECAGEFVTVISPASRNVESAQKRMVEIAVRHIDIWLALHGLPTMILAKLSRFRSGTTDYARMSYSERIKDNTDPGVNRQYLPEPDFFAAGTHVFFFDDIHVTGASAEQIGRIAMARGAKSFSTVFCVALDPKIVAENPGVEDRLNRSFIHGCLDEHVAAILNQDGFMPVQKMLRLLLDGKNRTTLAAFLRSSIHDDALLKLYASCLGNDYLRDSRFTDSVFILMNTLKESGLIGTDGLPHLDRMKT
ncbi:MAG: hypothetical protein HGB37_00380 [Candidatus Moranbacteria bacterium]|nr:hypothetical protein [Candidatus Moranbacteria bacterium]